jgi:hypothetical protein
MSPQQQRLTQKGGLEMKFSAPKQITWWIAVVIGVLGILAQLLTIPVLKDYAIWLVVIGFALLAVATVMEGL